MLLMGKERSRPQVTLSDLPVEGTFQDARAATGAGSADGTRWVTTMLDPPGGIETP